MDYSVKAIQAQQIYKIQPVTIDEKAQKRTPQQQQIISGGNPFVAAKYSPMHPSVENSPTLGRHLDLIS